MRKAFDLDPGIIYLNSGTHSICPREVLEAITRYQRAYERNPTTGLLAAWRQLWETQNTLATFFNANASDLFLRANVTQVMNACILGVPLPNDRKEILVTNLEYGAVMNVCRFRAERDGLSLREFHIPPQAEADALVNAVIAQLRPETSLLVLSHVTTGTGLVFPLEEIALETRKRGVLLAVDGAHAPGAIELDFKRLANVDFYGGNLHKWMMGPKGTAFGWVAPGHQETIMPLGAGWPTFECPDFYDGFTEASRFAQRFAMLGCHDFSPFFALNETLLFWKRHGASAIRARINELQRLAEAELASLAWKPLSPKPGPLRGPLLSYEVPERLQHHGALFLNKIYNEHRLQVSTPIVHKRLTLRISPHIYNTEDEIKRAVRILSTL